MKLEYVPSGHGCENLDKSSQDFSIQLVFRERILTIVKGTCGEQNVPIDCTQSIRCDG